MSVNLNQFEPTRIQGELDSNQPFGARVDQAVISASQATALTPGMSVKLDTAAQPALPSVIAAAVGDTAWGILIFSRKKASFTSGDIVEVARPGSVVWLTASGSIAAQAAVEDTATSGTVQTKNAQTKRGEAMDPATTGQLLRVQVRDY